MKEETWQPPADAIEREAQALYEQYWSHWTKPGYRWRGDMCSDKAVAVWGTIATHVLRERHRREGPLVAKMSHAERQFAYLGQSQYANEITSSLAAHAALDRESEPTPTLAEEVAGTIAFLRGNSGRSCQCRECDAASRLEAALAHERGK